MEPEYRPLIPPRNKTKSPGRPSRLRSDIARRDAKIDRRLTLTDEVHKKIVDAVKMGNHLDVSAQYAGVIPGTLYVWLSIGRGEDAYLKKNERYRKLADDVAQAQAHSEFSAVLQWRSAFGKDWHAAQKFLEVSFPERWKPKSEAERLSQPATNINISMQQGIVNSPIPANRSLAELIAENPALFTPALKAVNEALKVVEGEYTEISVDSPPVQYNDDTSFDLTRLLPAFTDDPSTNDLDE